MSDRLERRGRITAGDIRRGGFSNGEMFMRVSDHDARVKQLEEERDNLRELAEAGYGEGVRDTHTAKQPLIREWKARVKGYEDALRELIEKATDYLDEGQALPANDLEGAVAEARVALIEHRA